MLPPRLMLRGRSFDRVCVRRTGVGVYRGSGTYLRIGPGLASELATHRRMARRGFPVARVLERGYLRRLPYFVEGSLGAATLGELFQAEVDSVGRVCDESFDGFRDVIARQARAQATMARARWSADAFAALIGVERAVALHPAIGSAVRHAFGDAAARLDHLPATLLHTDLHPDNACLGGVIDVEGAGWGVIGYDVLTAVFVPAMCEAEPAAAGFSSAQITGYLRCVDDVFAARADGRLSDHLDDLLLCRAIALASRRHRDPGVWAIRCQQLRTALGACRSGGGLGERWGLDTA